MGGRLRRDVRFDRRVGRSRGYDIVVGKGLCRDWLEEGGWGATIRILLGLDVELVVVDIDDDADVPFSPTASPEVPAATIEFELREYSFPSI